MENDNNRNDNNRNDNNRNDNNRNDNNRNINNRNNINIIYHVDERHAINEFNYEMDVPMAIRGEMLRVLHQLRVPVYAAMAGAVGGGVAFDDMDQQAVAVLARSLYDARPVKHVIDVADGESDEKHGIREMTYDPETAEELKINTTCGIWQEEFEKGEPIKVLPCNHAFKADAITKWLTTEKAECPMCRFKLESKEVIVHPPAGEDYMPRLISDDDSDDSDDGVEVPQPEPLVNEQRARENNIMYRQNNAIYNRAHRGGAADMGRDLYYGMSMPMNRLIQMRASLVSGVRAGAGGGGAAAAASPYHRQPSQPAQPSPIVTNINNYYINRINQYQISAEEQEEVDIEEAIRRSLE